MYHVLHSFHSGADDAYRMHSLWLASLWLASLRLASYLGSADAVTRSKASGCWAGWWIGCFDFAPPVLWWGWTCWPVWHHHRHPCPQMSHGRSQTGWRALPSAREIEKQRKYKLMQQEVALIGRWVGGQMERRLIDCSENTIHHII